MNYFLNGININQIKVYMNSAYLGKFKNVACFVFIFLGKLNKGA